MGLGEREAIAQQFNNLTSSDAPVKSSAITIKHVSEPIF